MVLASLIVFLIHCNVEQLAARVTELDKHMQAVIDGVEVEKKRPPDVK
jgi:hypothetical protein